ncbi:MAG: restriction endonuclease subunit S [Brevundimonas sp.]|uniref:restriction endonuclease subunit S n=1 Tax=Brevundimonas sp. TaxID=1871086 RepID=UPI004033DA6D
MTTDVASLVSDNLDLWTSAVERKFGEGRGGGKKVRLYGIDRLRALILDLALRGQLVPQEGADEPAAALIPKMAAERQRRIKAGEIRNSKGPEKSSTEPYVLPSGWAWVPMWQTGNIFTGNSINETVRSELATNLEGLPFVATKDIGYGRDPIDYDNGLTVNINDPRFNIARANSVFICAEGGSAGRKIALSDRRIAFGNKLIANEPWPQLEPRFLLYTYLSDFFFDSFSREMTGIIGGISRAKFLTLPFPLPPTAEQARIVAKVDELMALCDALEAESASALEAHQTVVETLLATLVSATDPADLAHQWARLETHFDTLFETDGSINALKQTVLELAVRGKLTTQDASDEPAGVMLAAAKKAASNGASKSKSHPAITSQEQPFELPAGWQWERFDNLIQPDMPIAYGVLVPGDDVLNGVPFVRIADLSIDNPAPLPEKSISAEVDEKYERTRLKGGEILMGVVGSIGKLGVAPISWANANIARAICRIVPSDDVDRDFVLWLLQSRFMQNGFRGDTRTLAQPTLNIGLIRLAPTPVPPLAEQKRIVAKLDELMGLCEALRARIADTEQTRKHLADAVVERVVA